MIMGSENDLLGISGLAMTLTVMNARYVNTHILKATTNGILHSSPTGIPRFLRQD